jgi:hypothetical protein
VTASGEGFGATPLMAGALSTLTSSDEATPTESPKNGQPNHPKWGRPSSRLKAGLMIRRTKIEDDPGAGTDRLKDGARGAENVRAGPTTVESVGYR